MKVEQTGARVFALMGVTARSEIARLWLIPGRRPPVVSGTATVTT